MHVSKQKGRLPYHSIFCSDDLFFYPTESSETNSLFWSPLANFFHANVSQTGSLMDSNMETFPELRFQGLGPGLRLPAGGRKHPPLKDPIGDRATRPQQWGHKTYRVCQGRS